jgi:hypothetical protein
VALREWERRTAESARIASSSLPRVATGDIEVEHGTSEKLVANGAADDPGLLALEYLADTLIHP